MSERRFELRRENMSLRVADAIERSHRVREEAESAVRKSRERRAAREGLSASPSLRPPDRE